MNVDFQLFFFLFLLTVTLLSAIEFQTSPCTCQAPASGHFQILIWIEQLLVSNIKTFNTRKCQTFTYDQVLQHHTKISGAHKVQRARQDISCLLVASHLLTAVNPSTILSWPHTAISVPSKAIYLYSRGTGHNAREAVTEETYKAGRIFFPPMICSGWQDDLFLSCMQIYCPNLREGKTCFHRESYVPTDYQMFGAVTLLSLSVRSPQECLAKLYTVTLLAQSQRHAQVYAIIKLKIIMGVQKRMQRCLT